MAARATAKATTDEYADVPEAMDFAPEGWRPTAGDELTGKVSALSMGESEYGTYPIITLTTASGDDVAVHAFHTVLRKELTRMRPKVGHTLTIKYFGKQVGNGKFSKNGYDAYKVTSPEYEFDWNLFGKAPTPIDDDEDDRELSS